MSIIQKRSRRKVSGGRYKSSKKKRVYQFARHSTLTRVGKKDVRTLRARSGLIKQFLHTVEEVNLRLKDGKQAKVKVKSVIESPSNRNYIRRNIITKGCVVETEKGNARVTSRPGQVGTLNAVLL